MIETQEGIVFWHHWPDERMHDLSGPGASLHRLAKEAFAALTSDDFWQFVARLTTGRKLIVTSDHGYAACGHFPDLTDKDQANYMKALFKSGRSATSDDQPGSWVPPIDLRLTTSHGTHQYVLGRKKWKSHQKNEGFSKLKVADILMGGGTTIVEGARLGMQMYGNDLNPVAWFVVKNELAQVDPGKVKRLLDHIEAEVKPQIMPFYACDCPRGHKGKWTRVSTGKVMDESFDSLSLTPDERKDYTYEGPEVIYTLWAKHGPCQATECDHRTPIMSLPVIAVKTLTVKS